MARTRVTRCAPFRPVFATPRSPAPGWMTAAGPAPWAPQNPTTPGRCRAPTSAHGGPDPWEPQRGDLSAQVLPALRSPGPEPQHRADFADIARNQLSVPSRLTPLSRLPRQDG